MDSMQRRRSPAWSLFGIRIEILSSLLISYLISKIVSNALVLLISKFLNPHRVRWSATAPFAAAIA